LQDQTLGIPFLDSLPADLEANFDLVIDAIFGSPRLFRLLRRRLFLLLSFSHSFLSRLNYVQASVLKEMYEFPLMLLFRFSFSLSF
jgi:hypothetical protein